MKHTASGTRKQVAALARALVCAACFTAVAARSAEITIAWDPPEMDTLGNPWTGALHYRVYLGAEAGRYTQTVAVQDGTQVTIRGLDEGKKYYFACTALSGAELESARSSELNHALPDVTPPSIICEGSAVASADETGHGQVPDFHADAVVSDNCSAPQSIRIVQTPAPGARLRRGLLYRVLLEAFDEAGNTSRRYVDLTVAGPDAAARRPTLQWQAVEGASWYYLWVARNGVAFYAQWLNQSAATWTAPFDLPAGEYTWWVRGWGQTAGFAAWEGPHALSVPSMVPGEIDVLAPGGALSTNELVCRWDPDVYAAWYQVYVQKDGGLYRSQWLQNQTEYSAGAGLPYGTYACWVRGWSTDGYGPWSKSAVGTFGVTRPIAPTGTVTGTRRPELTWEACPVADGYELYVTVNGERLVYVPVGTNRWSAEADMPGGQYAWWVRVRGAQGLGPWSGAGAFAIPLTPPVAPTNLAAAPEGDGGVARYVWTVDPTATWYEIFITSEGKKVFSQWMETGLRTGAIAARVSGHQAGKTYQWWVRGWNADGVGPWSAAGALTF